MRQPQWAPIVALALATMPAWADEPAPEVDFRAANDRVLAGDAAGAIALYQHLETRGVVAADLAYNLGVALAQADRSLDAVVAWERALRLEPGHADARANLAATRSALPARAAPGEEPVVSLLDALEPVVAPLPRDAVALALLLAMSAASALWVLRRLGLLMSRGPLLAAWALTAAAVGAGAVVGVQQAVARDPRAVVRAAGPLKQGADQRFPDGAKVSAGERVRPLRTEGGWVEVQATDGVVGWLSAADLVTIAPL